MTLEQLRVFVSVAEREHMTRAAEALNLTQSAASAAIAALEARHAVTLFHRVRRRIELTEVGRHFLDEARAVLDQAARAEQALDEFGDLRRGTLRIVASQTIASYWLPTFLATYHQLHPQITLELATANTEEVASRVQDGKAELGFIEGALDNPALSRWVVGGDRMVLVSAEALLNVDLAWLRSAHWIMRERGSGTRSTLEKELRGRGIDPSALNIALTLPSNEAVRTAVEEGIGVAVLSALVVTPALRSKTLHTLPIEMSKRPFFCVSHKERSRGKAAGILLDIIGAKTQSAS